MNGQLTIIGLFIVRWNVRGGAAGERTVNVEVEPVNR